MQKSSLVLALGAGILFWGLGALETRAANVPLPTTLDQLLITGNTATVAASNETDTYSAFTYAVSSVPPGTTLAPSQITVAAFPPPSGGALESGLTFSGAINAPAGTTVDYAISYTVTAPTGSLLNSALLSVTWNNFGGTGASGSVGESLTNTGGQSLNLASFNSGPVSISFAGTQSVSVTKDIDLIGGTAGIGVSIVNQAFDSTSAVPEPTSLALLGIGMTGFFALRRFFKRTSVA